MAINNKSFDFPKGQLLWNDGLLTQAWQKFFRYVSNALNYVGEEYAFPLTNNLAVPASIQNMAFDSRFTSQAVIEYTIQRTTSTTELIQSGRLAVVYKPKTSVWTIVNSSDGPDVSGITFSILNTATVGAVQYVSSNLGGTASISRIFFRVRELAGKSSLYSKVG